VTDLLISRRQQLSFRLKIAQICKLKLLIP